MIEVNRGKFANVKSDIIKSVVKNTLEYLKEFAIMEKGDIDLSIALVTGNRITDLNRKYRGKNEPTDVLSFCYENNDNILEGEVVLSPEIIKENARKDGIKFQEELNKNIVHGILHIVGYEHSDEMFNLQKIILNKIN